MCAHTLSHTHIHLQPPSSPSSTIAFSKPPTHSAFPTTCSGTIHGNIPSIKCRKISDSDQLALKCLKTQCKASDDNDNDPDNNNNGTDNDEGLVPMKGG